MKILYVVTEDWYFLSHRLPLALRAIEDGYEVVIATRISKYRDFFEQKGMRVVNLRYMRRSSLNPLLELVALFELCWIFLKERPDLVHLVALKPVIYGSLASRIIGVRCKVYALGGLGFIFSSKNRIAKILRPVLVWLFGFIFNEKGSILILQNLDDYSLMEGLARVKARNLRLIPSAGVDMDQYLPSEIPEGTPIVMLASRLLWDKGVGEFVSAAKILHEQGVSCRFVLVGAPDPENPHSVPMEQIEEWKKSGVIEWWGRCDDMSAVLSQASVVCLPSYYGEGIPKVLVETMACARPIITTKMPGCRELVRSDKNGFLVNPRDPAALANALALILSNKSLCQKMGWEGRKIAVSEYSLLQVVGDTFRLYEYLLGK